MAGPIVHTYRAAESGLYVNSYLIEGQAGIVVVDTNLLVSDIRALRARLRALGKPLLAILVTHAHPDHFNGVLGLVKDNEVPVYATTSVGRAGSARRPAALPALLPRAHPAAIREPLLSEAAKSELGTAMEAFLPDAPLTPMIELGADAVAGELAAVRTAANPG